MSATSKEVLSEIIADMFEDEKIFRPLVNLIRAELEEKLEASFYRRRGEIGEIFKRLLNPNEKWDETPDGEKKEVKMRLSFALAALVGQKRMALSEVTKKVFEIVEEKGLYDPRDKKYVICDEALMKVIGLKRFEIADTTLYVKRHCINEDRPVPKFASKSGGSSSSSTPVHTKHVTTAVIEAIPMEVLRREITAISNRQSEEEESEIRMASPNSAATNETAPNVNVPNVTAPNVTAPNTTAPSTTAPSTSVPNMEDAITSVSDSEGSSTESPDKAAQRIPDINMTSRDIIPPNEVAPDTGPFTMVVPKTIIPLTFPPIILPLNTMAPSNASSGAASPITVAPRRVASYLSPEDVLSSFRIVPNALPPNMTTQSTTTPTVTAPKVTKPKTPTRDAQVPEVTKTDCCQMT